MFQLLTASLLLCPVLQHVVIIGSLGFIAIVTLLHIVGKVGVCSVGLPRQKHVIFSSQQQQAVTVGCAGGVAIVHPGGQRLASCLPLLVSLVPQFVTLILLTQA